MDMRVMEVDSVEQVIAPGPHPDDVGMWKVTASIGEASLVIDVNDPPAVGAFLVVEVESIETVPPADPSDAF